MHDVGLWGASYSLVDHRKNGEVSVKARATAGRQAARLEAVRRRIFLVVECADAGNATVMPRRVKVCCRDGR